MPRHLNNRTRPKARLRGLIIRTLVDSRGFHGLSILVKIGNLGIPNRPIRMRALEGLGYIRRTLPPWKKGSSSVVLLVNRSLLSQS